MRAVIYHAARLTSQLDTDFGASPAVVAPKSERGTPAFPAWTLAEAYQAALRDKAEFEARIAKAAASHPMASLRPPSAAGIAAPPTSPLSSQYRVATPGSSFPGKSPPVGLPRPYHPMSMLSHSAVRYSSSPGAIVASSGSQSSTWRPPSHSPAPVKKLEATARRKDAPVLNYATRGDKRKRFIRRARSCSS